MLLRVLSVIENMGRRGAAADRNVYLGVARPPQVLGVVEKLLVELLAWPQTDILDGDILSRLLSREDKQVESGRSGRLM